MVGSARTSVFFLQPVYVAVTIILERIRGALSEIVIWQPAHCTSATDSGSVTPLQLGQTLCRTWQRSWQFVHSFGRFSTGNGSGLGRSLVTPHISRIASFELSTKVSTT